MTVKKTFTRKNGEKVQLGYVAMPQLKGVKLDQRYFKKNEHTKARVWHDKQVSLAKRGYDQRLSLREAFEFYIDQLDVTASGRRYAINSLRCLSLDTPAWLGSRVCDLTTSDISTLFLDLNAASEVRLGRKRVNLKREVENLSAVFSNYKDSKNNDFQNPVTRIHKKKWCKRRSLGETAISLTVDETKALIVQLKNHHNPVCRHICLWQLTSNRQRIGEVLSLEWGDVDLDKNLALVTGTMLWTDENNKVVRNKKQYHTKEGRTNIPIDLQLNQHLKRSLLELKELSFSKRWVFANRDGKVPTLSYMTNVYKKTGFFNEKYSSTHKCRKTALTMTTINCGSEKAKLLGGHRTDSAHARYIDQMQKEMVNPAPALLAKLLGIDESRE